MVVNVERGERAHIKAELLLLRNVLRQFGVQAVNALNEQDIVLFEPQGVAAVLARACGEVVGRHLHLLAGDKVLQVLVELF